MLKSFVSLLSLPSSGRTVALLFHVALECLAENANKLQGIEDVVVVLVNFMSQWNRKRTGYPECDAY